MMTFSVPASARTTLGTAGKGEMFAPHRTWHGVVSLAVHRVWDIDDRHLPFRCLMAST